MDTKKTYKGNSVTSFPGTFIVIDVETTGRSTSYDEVIELAAIKISANSVIDSFSSLIRPSRAVSPFITELTGITNEMLMQAPDISSVLPEYLDFIGNSILVGHNITYDINFVNSSAEKCGLRPLANDYVDTLRIFRKLYPDLKHHRLMDLSEMYKFDYSNAHRALADCEITYNCFCALADEITAKYSTVDIFLKSTAGKSHKLKSSDISADVSEINPDNPFYGKVFVFTGTLEKMSRREAMQIVANHGGTNGDNVTKLTNYLVLGSNDYCSAISGGKSTKHKKAESLALAGQDIEIIPEDVFYDMISE